MSKEHFFILVALLLLGSMHAQQSPYLRGSVKQKVRDKVILGLEAARSGESGLAIEAEDAAELGNEGEEDSQETAQVRVVAKRVFIGHHVPPRWKHMSYFHRWRSTTPGPSVEGLERTVEALSELHKNRQ